MQKPQRRKFRQQTVIHSYIVKPLAQELVLLLWHTNIHPNQLTFIRSVISLIALYLFAIGEIYGFIWGIILFQISEVIDHADGMLARMKNMVSSLGQCYEYITDELFSTEHGLLGLSIAYGVYNYNGSIICLYLAVFILIFYYLTENVKITINSHRIISTMEINHDKQPMLKIFGISLKQSIKNISKTIFIWRNQLLLMGVICLIYIGDIGELLLIGVFMLFLLLNALRFIRELKIGFIKHKV